MQVTWLDLKTDIYDKMDLDTSEYSEYDTKIISNVNRALIDLSKLFPIRTFYSKTMAESEDDGYTEYDMKAVTEIGNDFDGFVEDNPVLYLDDERGYIPATDYIITDDRYLSLKTANDGTFRITYRKSPTKITSSTSDDMVMELDIDVVNIIPLYVAGNIFRAEKELELGVQYINEYNNAKEELFAMRKRTQKPKVSIIAGDYDGL